MAQDITLMGASYSDVPAVLLPKTGSGTARFTDVSDTTAAAGDVASGKYFYTSSGVRTQGTSSGGGGSGIGTLINTTALGNIRTSSTSASDTGKDVVVKGINGYDLLIVETSVDTIVVSRHVCTVRLVFLTCGTMLGTVSGAALENYVWNAKQSNTLTNATTRANTTARGVYPYDCTVSTSDNGTATMNMYTCYNSTHTGTINNSYTTRVYGVKLYDLIGG